MTTSWHVLIDHPAGKGILKTSIDADDTTIVLNTGHGANFPASGSFWVRIDVEQIEISSRTDDTLTVANRGHGGTTAVAHNSGASVTVDFFSEHLTEIQTAINSLEEGSGASVAWETPGTIGSTTPNTGAFTTLSATGKVTTPASGASAAGIIIPPGTAPSSPVNGDVWTTTTGIYVRINGVTVGPLISAATLAAPPAIGNTTPAAGSFTTLSATGKTTLPAGTAGSASVIIPHGTAPSSPVDGDVWTTTSGIYIRVNGTTVGPLISAATLASPPAIGGTTAAAVTATTLTATSAVVPTIGVSGNTSAIGITSGGVAIAGTLAPTGKTTLPASTTLSAPLKITEGVAPSSPVAGDVWITADGMYVYTSTGGLVGPLGTGGTGTVNWASPGQIGSLAPNTGKFTTLQATSKTTAAAGTTGAASISIPHGTAPTSPVNGDVWTTTAGLYVHINGTTIGPLSASNVVDLASPGTIGGTTPGAINATTIDASGNVTIDGDLVVDGLDIGITGATDLIGLANDGVTIRGDLTITGAVNAGWWGPSFG